MLSQEYGLVARCGGGNNAGHTVVVGDTTYDFHLLPSGIASPDCMGVIGNGLVVHLPGLFAEIAANEAKGLRGWQDRLKISDRAHVVLDLHQSMDALQEEARGGGKIGTTRKGIGPCYAAKAARAGARIADLVHDFPRFEAIFRRLVAEAVLQFPTLHIDIEGQLARYQEYGERSSHHCTRSRQATGEGLHIYKQLERICLLLKYSRPPFFLSPASWIPICLQRTVCAPWWLILLPCLMTISMPANVCWSRAPTRLCWTLISARIRMSRPPTARLVAHVQVWASHLAELATCMAFSRPTAHGWEMGATRPRWWTRMGTKRSCVYCCVRLAMNTVLPQGARGDVAGLMRLRPATPSVLMASLGTPNITTYPATAIGDLLIQLAVCLSPNWIV